MPLNSALASAHNASQDVPEVPKTPWHDFRKGFIDNFNANYDFTPGDKRSVMDLYSSRTRRIQAIKQDLIDNNAMDNLKWFTPTTLQTYPTLVANELMDSPPRLVRNWAKVLNAVTPWLAEQDSINGIPNALKDARNYAWATHKTEALKFLDMLKQTVDPDTRNIILSVLANPGQYAGLISYSPEEAHKFADAYATEHANDPQYLNPDGSAKTVPVDAPANAPQGAFASSGQPTQFAAYADGVDIYNRQHLTANITPDQWEQAIAKLEDETGIKVLMQGGGDSGKPLSGLVQLPAANESVDTRVAMRQLFEIGKQGFFRFAIGEGLSNAEAIAANPQGTVGQGIVNVVGVPVKAVFAAAGVVISPFIKAYNAAYNKALDVGSAVAARGSGLKGKDYQDYLASNRTQMAGANPFVAFQKTTDAVASTVVTPLTGAEEGTVQYDNNMQVISGLMQMFLLKKVGEVGRASYAAENFAPDFAKQQLEIASVGEAVKGSIAPNLPGALGRIASDPLLHPFRVLSYAVKKATFDLLSKPLEVAVKDGDLFKTQYDIISRIKADSSIPADEKFGVARDVFTESVPNELLSRLMDPAVHTVDDMAAINLEFFKAPDFKALEAAQSRLAVINSQLFPEGPTGTSPPMTPAVADVLTLEKTALESKIGEIKTQAESPPPFEYPKYSKVQKMLVNPTSHLERFVRGMYQPISKFRFLESFMEDMPNRITFHNPALADRPLNWAEDNASNLQQFLSRTGVPARVIEGLQKEAYALKDGSSQDFFKFNEKIASTINEYLPSSTPADVRANLTEFWKTSLEDRVTLMRDMRIIRQDGSPGLESQSLVKTYLTDAEGNQIAKPLPSLPSDFVKNVLWPDVNQAIEATSLMRRAARTFPPVRIAYSVVRGAMRASTVIFKPLVLVSRMPSVAMRVELEQAVRGRMEGNFRAIAITPGGVSITPHGLIVMLNKMGIDIAPIVDSRFVGFTSGKDMSIGSMIQGLSQTPGEMRYFPDPTIEYRLGLKSPPARIFTGWAQAVNKLRVDNFARPFIQHGMDVEATFKLWQEGGLQAKVMRDISEITKSLRQQALDTGRGIVPDATLVKEWMSGVRDVVNTVTGSNPELLHAIATGKLGGQLDIGAHLVDPVTGQAIGDIYGTLAEKSASIREALATFPERAAMGEEARGTAKALRVELRKTVEEMNKIERDFPEATVVGHSSVESTRATAKYLREAWTNHEIEMPSRIVTKGKYSFEDAHGTGETATIGERAHIAGTYISHGYSTGAYAPFRLLSWADEHTTRNAIYLQAALRHREALLERGYSKVDATAFGELYGAEYARKLLYDLSSRNSAHRALKDVFWFAPAQQELIATWFYRIPKQFGLTLPGGYALGVAKVNAILELLRGSGIVHKDSNDDYVVAVPYLADLISLIPGMKHLDSVTFPLRGINLVTSNPFPTISTLPAAVIGAGGRHNIPGLKQLSDALMWSGLMFSEDTTAIPSMIYRSWEALTGNKLPVGDLSPAYVKASYDRRMDQALQLQADDMFSAGDTPPRSEDFGTRNADTGLVDMTDAQAQKFHDASEAWLARLLAGGKEYFKTTSFLGMLSNLGSPASLYANDNERIAWQNFWDKLVADGNISDADAATIDAYLADHPGANAYATFYTRFTGKPGPAQESTNPDGTMNQDWFQNYFNGQKEYYTPEDFARVLMTTASYRHYVGQYHKALTDISPTLDTPTLLSHGFERSEALTRFQADWNLYQTANPESAAILAETKNNWKNEYGIPVKSFETERLGNTLVMMKELAPYFSTEWGNRNGDYKTVMAGIKQLYSAQSDFGKPTTKSEKEMAWYFDSVMSPWADKVYPLYEQARKLSEAGLDAGKVYDQIRAINNSYSGKSLSYNGKSYPTPEEVIYGNKSPVEQGLYKLNLDSKPVLWLTNYQMDLAKLPSFAGREKLVAELQNFDTSYHDQLAAKNVAPGSAYADQLEQWRFNSELAIAKKYGDPGVGLFKLNEATPVTRIDASGYGAGNTDWQWAADTAAAISARLKAAGLSTSGYSQQAIYYKQWFYGELMKRGAMDANTSFGRLLEEVGYAIPDTGDDQRTGTPLFEALYFGNFSSQYLPPELLVTPGG